MKTIEEFHQHPVCGFCGKSVSKNGDPLLAHKGRDPRVPIDMYYHRSCYDKWKVDIKNDPLYGKAPMYAPIDE